MSGCSHERIGEILAEMERDGVSYATKGEELGIPPSTLYSAARRYKGQKRKDGRKTKSMVQVVDAKKPKSPKMTLLERLDVIQAQLDAVRETLRSIV